MMSINPNANYHTEINLNQVARFASATETVECSMCCFYIQQINDHIDYPVFNGTHLINGTDVYNAITTGIGITILDGNITVLPCPQLYYAKKLYYYYTNDAEIKNTHIMLIIIVIINMIFLY